MFRKILALLALTAAPLLVAGQALAQDHVAPLTWDEVPDCEPADFTLTTMPKRFAEIGDRHAGIDGAVGSLDALLDLSARHEREGQGDAPWPPHYQKQPGEPPRVQPSKSRSAKRSKDETGADDEALESKRGTKSIDAVASKAKRGRKRADTAPPKAPRRQSDATPKGRRVPKRPLIEIGRAKRISDAVAGLDRWKARHPEVTAHLQPEDVLVDSMRGRSSTWTRIRVNLQHVPEELRPPQEPLDPDYDARVEWEGMEWPG